MSVKLKPCPFCGHEPRIDGNTIVCGYCGAHMHAFDSSIDWLVKNWNCRVEVNIVTDRKLLDKIARLEEFREGIDEQFQCEDVVEERGGDDA